MRNPFPDEQAIMLWSIPEFAIAILKYCHAAVDPSNQIKRSCFHNGFINTTELATHIGRLALGADTAAFSDRSSPDVEFKTMAATSWLETKGYFAPAAITNSWREKWITPAGEEAAKAGPDIPIPDVFMIPRDKLHPNLRDGAWGDFARREYSTAVFKAYLQVEIYLREKSGLNENTKSLITGALSVEYGPLRVPNGEKSEQDATKMLFLGAMSLFRNAAGHNIIEYDDPERAAREFQLADLLLRIIDDLHKVEKVEN